MLLTMVIASDLAGFQNLLGLKNNKKFLLSAVGATPLYQT